MYLQSLPRGLPLFLTQREISANCVFACRDTLFDLCSLP